MNLNPLEQIDWRVMIAIAAIVGATYLALRRVFVLPYLRVMEERASLLSDAEAKLAEADRLRAEADAEAESLLAAARADADEALDAARGRAEANRAEVLAQANAEAATRLESGRARVAEARESAMTRMRDQAVECVTLACERLVGEIDRSDAEQAVDDSLARLTW